MGADAATSQPAAELLDVPRLRKIEPMWKWLARFSRWDGPARRYANHKGGLKYDKKTGKQLPGTNDMEKAAAAVVFYERYVAARQHPEYIRQKSRHKERHEAK